MKIIKEGKGNLFFVMGSVIVTFDAYDKNKVNAVCGCKD